MKSSQLPLRNGQENMSGVLWGCKSGAIFSPHIGYDWLTFVA